MTTPDQIEDQITRTRTQLSSDVDRLSEKVSPSKVVGRRVDAMRSGMSSVRDRVMGSGESDGAVAIATSSLSAKASDLSDAASSAPAAMRNQTQGNPLAAGLIAFGVGWLLSSLAPASRAEQQLSASAESKARDMAEPLKQSAQEMASSMKEPLQQAAEEVKSTAADAAQDTADQAKSAADDVKAPLQQSSPGGSR
jgi:hypothetical protein